MHRLKLHPLVLAALVASVATAVPAQSRAVLVTLAPPTYPPIARAAHISGDMVLTVTVNKAGAETSAPIDARRQLIFRWLTHISLNFRQTPARTSIWKGWAKTA